MLGKKKQDKNIDNTEHFIYEWEKERELYTPEMWEKFYNQKVDMVIGDIDLNQHREINRPLMCINMEQANEISNRVKARALQDGFVCESYAYYDKSIECHRIHVKVLRDLKVNQDDAFKLDEIKLIHKNKFLHNYEITFSKENGIKKVYEVINRNPNLTVETFGDNSRLKPDAVGMLVFNFNKTKVLLQKEFRFACGEWVYNLPGGLVDEGETLEQAAARELKEETGIVLAEILDVLPPAYTAVGIGNESVATVIGIGVGNFSKSTSEYEQIEPGWYTREEVKELIKNGEAMSLRTQTALYMWANECKPTNTVSYNGQDTAVTEFLYRGLKRTEIEHEIERLKKEREMCDDYVLSDKLTKKIIKLKEDLNNLK